MNAASKCITRSFKNPLHNYYRGSPEGVVGSLLLGTVSVVRKGDGAEGLCIREGEEWRGVDVWVCSDMAGREGKGVGEGRGWVENGRVMYRVGGWGVRGLEWRGDSTLTLDF